MDLLVDLLVDPLVVLPLPLVVLQLPLVVLEPLRLLHLVVPRLLLECLALAPPTMAHHQTVGRRQQGRQLLQLQPLRLPPRQSLHPQLHPSQHRQRIHQLTAQCWSVSHVKDKSGLHLQHKTLLEGCLDHYR